MEKCPVCYKEIDSVKLLNCKFCGKLFCSLSCLVKHASTHLKNDTSNSNIVNSLKRKQSANMTEQYYFITTGYFHEKPFFDPKYSKNNFTKVLIDDFLPQELGSGSFGRVYLIKHKETNKEYALKVIDKKKVLNMYGKLDIIYNEINIHSKLEHENIIRVYNIYEEEDSINIIMEYAKNGNLYNNIIEKKLNLSEEQVFEYFIQIINAVYYLHQNNIIHRDIKPENILISEENKLKLCDFGWAKELTLENRSTFCGTVEYMAPEIVGSENYDYSVDMWSLGILFYELLFGHSPFQGKNTKSVMLSIKNHHDIIFDKDVSDSCKDLIQQLLNVNPQKRLKIKDIIQHRFIEKNAKNYLLKRQWDLNNKNIENNIKNKEEGIFNKFIFLEKNNEIQRVNSILEIKEKKETKIKTLNDFNNNKPTLRRLYIQHNEDFSEKNLCLEKLRDSFFVEKEKAKKKFKKFNFINKEYSTFEDIRDIQKNNLIENKGMIKNVYLEKKDKIQILKSKKNKHKNEKKIIPEENTKTDDYDVFGEFLQNDNDRAAIERLNKAYYKFGKKENYN